MRQLLAFLMMDSLPNPERSQTERVVEPNQERKTAKSYSYAKPIRIAFTQAETDWPLHQTVVESADALSC